MRCGVRGCLQNQAGSWHGNIIVRLAVPGDAVAYMRQDDSRLEHNIKNIWHSLRANRDLPAANALVAAFRTVAAVVFYVSVIAWSYGLNLSAATFWFIAALTTFVFAGLIGIVLWRKASVDRARVMRLRNPHLRFHTIERFCEVRSKVDHVLHSRNTVSATKEGVDSYRMSLLWSGEGDIEVRCLSPESTVIIRDAETTREKLIHFVFSKKKRKGEKFVVEYVISTSGNKSVQKPYMCESVSEFANGPEEILLSVSFRNPTSIERVWAEDMFSSKERGVSAAEQELSTNLLGNVEYRPKHIECGKRYCVKWQYKSDPGQD